MEPKNERDFVKQAAARRSLDELLAPIHKEFAATGISDDELIIDITNAQAEYRAEKLALKRQLDCALAVP